MKKNILFLIILSIFFSCAVKKPEKRSKFLKGFSANYNTFFNSEEALKSEFDTRTAAHQDNFYAPYITLLTYDENPKSSIAMNPIQTNAIQNNTLTPPPSKSRKGAENN
jgi:hypothetical protein